VRLRLTDPSVYRLVDDEDVCQSVLRSFFCRARLGQYDLSEPGQLLRLLMSMTRNKLIRAARREHTEKRGGGRVVSVEGKEDLAPASVASPSKIAEQRDLLEQVRRRLSDEERQVADLRALGREWVEVARQLGGTADGRRMQHVRALDRVSRELGLAEEGGDDA
jgi:hypothetical protein